MKIITLSHLALFIGANCNILEPLGRGFLPGIKTITGVNEHGVILDGEEKPYPANQIRPFLRQFSDLTDIEAAQLLSLRTGRDCSRYNVVVTKNEHTWIVAAYEKEYNKKEELECVELIHYNPTNKQLFTAAEITFFVDLLFDIFGFIETGQAEPIVTNLD